MAELEKIKIESPTGKEKWSKRTIEVMLSNEKYLGTVRLLNSKEREAHYVSKNNNHAIIKGKIFKAV